MILAVFDSSSSQWQMAELLQFHCGEKQTYISKIILHRHPFISLLHLLPSDLSVVRSAGTSLSCQRVKAGWHSGPLTTSSQSDIGRSCKLHTGRPQLKVFEQVVENLRKRTQGHKDAGSKLIKKSQNRSYDTIITIWSEQISACRKTSLNWQKSKKERIPHQISGKNKLTVTWRNLRLFSYNSPNWPCIYKWKSLKCNLVRGKSNLSLVSPPTLAWPDFELLCSIECAP